MLELVRHLFTGPLALQTLLDVPLPWSFSQAHFLWIRAPPPVEHWILNSWHRQQEWDRLVYSVVSKLGTLQIVGTYLDADALRVPPHTGVASPRLLNPPRLRGQFWPLTLTPRQLWSRSHRWRQGCLLVRLTASRLLVLHLPLRLLMPFGLFRFLEFADEGRNLLL